MSKDQPRQSQTTDNAKWNGPLRIHWKRDGRGMTGYVAKVITSGARAASGGVLLDVESNGRHYRISASELLPESEAYRHG